MICVWIEAFFASFFSERDDVPILFNVLLSKTFFDQLKTRPKKEDFDQVGDRAGRQNSKKKSSFDKKRDSFEKICWPVKRLEMAFLLNPGAVPFVQKSKNTTTFFQLNQSTNSYFLACLPFISVLWLLLASRADLRGFLILARGLYFWSENSKKSRRVNASLGP